MLITTKLNITTWSDFITKEKAYEQLQLCRALSAIKGKDRQQLWQCAFVR